MLYRCQSKENTVLAFVYCNNVSREQQSPLNLMGALLCQLIDRLSFRNPIVEDLIRCRSEGKPLDLNTIVDYIRRIGASRKATRVIRLGADGLNELLPHHRDVFLKSLGTLSAESNIQFLFFCRDNAGIQAELANSFGGPTSFTCYNINGESTTHDRCLFLQNCLNHSKDWALLDERMKDTIFSHLAGPDSTFVILSIVFTELIAATIGSSLQTYR
jgi:hypothetical protein